MTWRTKRLGDLADLSLGKMLDKQKNKGVLRPYLANVNVRWGTYDFSNLREMRFEEREFEKYGVRSGDIVVCEGGEPGRCAIWRDQRPGMMLQKALHRVRSGAEIDHRFLYYSLVHKGQTRALEQYFTGSTIKHLPREKLALVQVEFPALEVQSRVASILSAYDDLIENNTRRIEILEEMARRIYEEWFVRFRFPGHQGVRMVESELGLVPAGWRTDVLARVCEPRTGIQTGPFGSQLHKADYSDVGVPVLMPKDLIGFRVEEGTVARVPEATAESLKRHRMRPGDIAYGRRGDIGRRAFIMAHQTGWLCGTGCLRIRPDAKEISGWYVFNYLGQENVVGLIAGRAHGVTMPNLNARLLESVPVVCPPRELQDQFERTTFPMAELRESLIAKNANLKTTRDLLLPKLISGELDVAALPEPEALAA